ncbi:Ig-like domain-containing protein [Alicyclobacillus dauci]|uniref:Ig-like domain-containing protein n=1 Tax=Alicyclobacillus dauci TaxID=1475485 RepID=A0ABY6Z6Z2_9BACL|nr:Ig-like domain-containing protein [Alicyclobacillus dauci]WAH38024.1 Ig-like domain-containing protein [Alicyclobacillus dauci]
MKNVTPVDAKHVVVNFTRPVDKTSASLTSNYSLSGDAAITSATVSADGQSVTLTLGTALSNDKGFALTISKGLKDTAGDTLASDTDSVTGFYFADHTAPTIASISAAANGDLKVQYSEPLSEGVTPTIVIDGSKVDSGISVSGNTVTVSKDLLPTGLTNGTTHQVIISNAQDLVGNTMSLYQGTFNYTIPVAQAPSVTSLSATGEAVLTVTFNEPVNYTKDANASTLASDLGLTVTKSGSAVAPSNITTSDGQTFVITLPNSVFSGGNTTAALNVTFKGFKDVLDHIGNQYSQDVTLSEDTTAPALVSAQYDTAKSEAVVNFNKALLAASGLKGHITVIDNKTGAPVTTFSVNNVSKDDTSVDITGLAQGSYSITFAADTVKSDTIAQKGNESFTTQVTVPASTTPPTINTADVAVNKDNSQTITLTFSEAVRGGAAAGSASATNPANYLLNQHALPQGTTITMNSSDTATGTVTVTTSDTPKTADAAGNTLVGGTTVTATR